MRKLVLITLVFLFVLVYSGFRACSAETTQDLKVITGPLCYYFTGSMQGEGQVFADGRRHRFLIWKMMVEWKNFTGKDEQFSPGAIWEVAYEPRPGYDGSALKIRWTGKTDERIKESAELLRHHYRLISEKKYSEAYLNLGEKWRGELSREAFAAAFRGKKLNSYAGELPWHAMMVDRSAPDGVYIFLDYSWIMEENSVYRFHIVREKGKVVIESVSLVKNKSWHEL